MFDRHIEGQNRKCQQRLILHSNIIQFPCFADATGVISFLPFHLVAVTFHLGHSPNSGHHRAALRYRGGWLVYDDNRLPDHITTLTDEILSNATMFWLVRPNATAVRTIEHPSDVELRARTAALHSGSPADGSAANTINEAAVHSALSTALDDESKPDAPSDVEEPMPKKPRNDSKD
jgi:hypothetical protein